MRVSSIALVCILIGLARARITYLDVIEAEFRTFKEEHQKVYENEDEELKRMQIFMDNKNVIDKHNKRYDAGEETYKMGVNQFTDLLPSEFRSQMLLKLNASEMTDDVDDMYFPDDLEALPVNVDWRAKGAVTSVKNQGSCGSCWSFAAAGALESHHFIKTRQLIPLSEQNLMDCSRRYGNNGCKGGWPASALKYVKDNHGIDLESAYPYEAQLGRCRFNPHKVGAKVSSVIQVAPNEYAMANVVAYQGPVAVAVDATNFQHYRSGIFNGPCAGQINHAVIVVGYGGNYWLIKNSWGKSWGEQGYMRLARNHNNLCHVASYAVFPNA